MTARRLRNLGPRLGDVAGKLSTKKRPDPFYRSPKWQALSARVKAAAGGRCSVPGCLTPYDRVTADHIVEIRDGGEPLDPHNLQILCHPCHLSKTHAARAARAEGGRP